MQLIALRVEAETTDESGTRLWNQGVLGSPLAVALGPLEVTLALSESGAQWSVANHSDRSLRVRSVALVYRLVEAAAPVRIFCNGYQSWSPSAGAVLGVDTDPSERANLPFLQAVHHADQRQARP